MVKNINELISIEDIPKKMDFIFWNNGKITFSRPLVFGKFITFQVFKNEKKLRYWSMDDWSEIKNLPKIIQALKDCIRAKIIDLSWSIIIPDKENTLRSLGSVKIKNIIKINTDYNKIIPYSFHGTSTEYLPFIMKFGIKARVKTKTKPNWENGYIDISPNYIYLSTDHDRALYYAQHTVDSDKKHGIKSKPIVLRIDNLESKYATSDDDYKTHKNLLLMQLINTGKKPKGGYVESIRNTSQFAYTVDIPLNKISKIYNNYKSE